jgi:hypothetical protein
MVPFIVQVGVIAGMIMGAIAMVLNKLKFTTLNLTQYFGALVTGKAAGKLNFISGFLLHLLASGFFAWIYLFFIMKFHVALTMVSALLFGVIHTLCTGMSLPFFDKINLCVVQKTIKPAQCFASGYGITAVITFVAGHVIYALIVFVLLAR